MYRAVFMILFAGSADPTVLDRPPGEPMFVGRAACVEWATQEARRVARVIAALKPKDRPQEAAVVCVPAAPERDAAL